MSENIAPEWMQRSADFLTGRGDHKKDMVPEGFMRDSVGNLIAVENIRPVDLARDELVREIYAKVKVAHDQLKKLKAEVMGDVEAFIAMSLERYGVKEGGPKGNLTFETFDGAYQVKRQIAVHIVFDEGLHAAKVLIDECLHDWSEGSNANIRTLIDHAFRVNKEGKLNMGAILSLQQLKIDDEKWQQAMKAIAESVKESGRRPYVRVYERNEAGGYDHVSLDIAAL